MAKVQHSATGYLPLNRLRLNFLGFASCNRLENILCGYSQPAKTEVSGPVNRKSYLCAASIRQPGLNMLVAFRYTINSGTAPAETRMPAAK